MPLSIKEIAKHREEFSLGYEKVTLTAKRILKLPAKLRKTMLNVFRLDEKGESVKGYDYEKMYQAYEECRQLSDADIKKIIKALRPELASELELARKFTATLPARKNASPFRISKKSKFSNSQTQQADWLIQFLRETWALKPKYFKADWMATWIGHQVGPSNACAIMLASLIEKNDKQGKTVFNILVDSANSVHEIGIMSWYIPAILLMPSRPECWEYIEKLLLAAQRQEGLRQSVLSGLNAAHPGAVAHLFRVMAEHKLVRFSAVVASINQYLGYNWDSASVGVVSKVVNQFADFTTNSTERKKAFKGELGDTPEARAEAAYLALRAESLTDVESIAPHLKRLLNSDSIELRYAAAKTLQACPVSDKFKGLHEIAYRDEDIRIALAALEQPRHYQAEHQSEMNGTGKGVFDALEMLLHKMPTKRTALKPLIWPWSIQEACRDSVGNALIGASKSVPITRLIENYEIFSPSNRATTISILAKPKKWSEESRATIIKAIGDKSSSNRNLAFHELKKKQLRPEEILSVETLLARKSDVRVNAINLLNKQKPAKRLESAQRMLNSSKAPQRLGGLELIRQLVESGKMHAQSLALIETWQSGRRKVSAEELIQCNEIRDAGKPPITLDNGLGLFDPSKLTISKRPKPPSSSVKTITPATIKLVEALDKLCQKQAKTILTVTGWDGVETELPFGSAPHPHPNFKEPFSKQKENFLLGDLWIDWFENRPKSLRDADDLTIHRALKLLFLNEHHWRLQRQNVVVQYNKRGAKHKKFTKDMWGVPKKLKLKNLYQVTPILHWLNLIYPAKGIINHQLSAGEKACQLVPQPEIDALENIKQTQMYSQDSEKDFRSSVIVSPWLELDVPLDKLSKIQFKRLWEIKNWADKPSPKAKRFRCDGEILKRAFVSKLCNLDDVADALVGPDADHYSNRALLSELTMRRPRKATRAFLKKFKSVVNLVDSIRDRIMEIELSRGEKPTPATELVSSIGSFWGTDNLMRLLTGLGKARLGGGLSYGHVTKPDSIALMIRSTFPSPDDTVADFSKRIKSLIKEGTIAEDRVLELAFFAPQWAATIEQHLKWPGMLEALYWFFAHMYVYAGDNLVAGTDYDDDPETQQRNRLSSWDRLILERTSLTAAQRGEGGVDVQWFHRIHKGVGAKRFEKMAVAARFGSTGAQAKRARYIGEVLTGTADKKELIQKIKERHLKENVRLLGLMPLATGRKRDADVRHRYEVLQEYLKYAKGLSSLSKPDAIRASEIGFENMARTAGFRDPLRMQWALEAESTKDLKKGFLEAKKDDVVLRMDVNEKGMPIQTITRGEKLLKSLPSKYRKENQFVEIRARAKQLKTQSARIRTSLEQAMINQDQIDAKELKGLADHAVLWPMLSRLVLIGDGIYGYPDKGGKALRDYRNKLEPIKAKEKLVIAHPSQLLKAKKWSAWQKECINSERMQPFKQLFRELYVVTAQEKKDKRVSKRYAGQQIQPRQAKALWAARGWNSSEEVWKSFPDLGLNVDVGFEYGWGSPLEVEGLTLEGITFRKRGDYKPVELKKVPAILFSEVMRDMDLVVSVAHRGGVDPEASASTVEMRETLVLETSRLLGLKNVKIKKSHVMIKGHHSDYAIHLGSGEVHVTPGGHICVVAVGAQHRGRIFLPFADDDPKTAEVLSKVLLFADDKSIQDPTILTQINWVAGN